MKLKRKLCCLLLTFLSLWMLAVPAQAVFAPYHAPTLTIITENAPDDLTIMIRLHQKDGRIVPVILEKTTRSWEQQFRLFRDAGFNIKAWYGNDYDLRDAELVLQSGGEEQILVLPRELTDRMSTEDVIMLDYKTGDMRLGDPIWRGPLMALLRTLVPVGLALLIFLLRGYRERRSLLTVLLGGLISYGFLSYFSSGWLNFNVREIIPYAIALFLVFLLQSLANLILIEEESRDHCFVTTMLAFLVSAVSNILMLFFLPI